MNVSTSTGQPALAAVAQSQALPGHLIEPLRDSRDLLDDPPRLRERPATDGYLYVPGFFARDDVMAARRDIFTRLADVDEIAEPPIDGIATGRSARLASNHAPAATSSSTTGSAAM